MAQDIKVIETYYNGYRFRSRLEARWAVFFDALGVKYEYEPEGFKATGFCDMNGNQKTHYYLPDFYFPESDCYGEVKSRISAIKKEEEKISWCIDYNNTPISKGIILLCQIPYWDEGECEVPLFPFLKWNKGVCCNDAFFGHKKIHECWWAGHYNDYSSAPELPEYLFRYPDSGYRLDLRTFVEMDGMLFEMDQQYKSSHSWTLRRAFMKARQARFEHGEKPNINN